MPIGALTKLGYLLRKTRCFVGAVIEADFGEWRAAGSWFSGHDLQWRRIILLRFKGMDHRVPGKSAIALLLADSFSFSLPSIPLAASLKQNPLGYIFAGSGIS